MLRLICQNDRANPPVESSTERRWRRHIVFIFFRPFLAMRGMALKYAHSRQNLDTNFKALSWPFSELFTGYLNELLQYLKITEIP